jgi:hypothetical protein
LQGATWFDLSLRSLGSRLSGISKQELAKLVHMVADLLPNRNSNAVCLQIFLAAVQLQPSIVYIDECEKVFVKNRKVPPEYINFKKNIIAHKQLLASRDNRVLVTTHPHLLDTVVCSFAVCQHTNFPLCCRTRR